MMRKTILALVAAGLAPIGFSAPAEAANITLKVTNTTPNAALVSVYSASRKERWDMTCVSANQTHELGWTPGAWNGTGGGIHVRWEFKSGSQCSGSTIGDSGYGRVLTPDGSGLIQVYVF